MQISSLQVKGFPTFLQCPSCRGRLRRGACLNCGFLIRKLDGISLALPPGEAAVWHDSDSLAARMGRSWRRKLKHLGERKFVDCAVRTPRPVAHAPLVTLGQRRQARKMSGLRRLRRSCPPQHEPDAPIAWVTSVIQRFKPMRILDVGIGGGFQLCEIARRSPRASVIGVDRDFLCLRVANSRLKLNQAKAIVLGADARRLPFKSAYFDCVSSNFALWHMEGFGSVVEEIARVLKPSGRFIGCEMDHNFLVWGIARERNLRMAKAFGLYGNSSELIRTFTRRGFMLRHSRKHRHGVMEWRELHLQKAR